MGMTLSHVRCDAAADPTILPPPPPAPGQSYGAEPPSAPQEAAYVSEALKLNPGTYEELHKKCKEIFPLPFEGAKFVLNKSLNQGFHVSHSIAMSTVTPSGYRFGSTYVGTKMVSPQDPAVILIADIDPSANLNAQGIYNVSEQLRFKYMTQVMNSKFAVTQVTADMRGSRWTVTGTMANPNLFNDSGVGIFQCLYAINPKICAGFEVMHQRAPQIPGGSATLASVGGRYTTEDSVWSAFMGTGGLGINFYKRINEEIQVGVEVENSQVQQATTVALGYQFDIPKSNFSMKAMVDNNWTVTGVMEKRLLPMPFMFSLCGTINHVKNQFRLGCGLTIGV